MRRPTKRHVLLPSGAFLFGLLMAAIMLREPMVALTEATLETAKRHWGDAGIRDYDLQVRMHGSDYDVCVRDGIVVRVETDGRQSGSADRGAYSIDGLFDILEMELDALSDPRGPFAGNRQNVLMRVRFHAELGYLERYLRSGGGQRRSVSIELLSFAVHPAANGKSEPRP